jgi:inosine-uridine nucleoside N-ribohydrolase
MDFNTQCDPRAALIVAESGAALTLVQLPVAMRCSLTSHDLEPLAATGPLGALLAEQSRVHGEDSGFADLAAEHERLPDDLVNFHWDPLAAAVAAGWSGATTERVGIRTAMDDGITTFRRDPKAREIDLVTDVDAAAFGPYWLERVRDAQPVRGS